MSGQIPLQRTASTILSTFNTDFSRVKLIVNSVNESNVKLYEPAEWSKNGFLREYKTLSNLGAAHMAGISPTAYASGHFFIVWNLCPDMLLGGAAEIIRPGNLSLDISFKTALAQPINIIVYAQFDNTIEITHDKEAIRNWI